MILFAGLMYAFGFVMSFDAPGSMTNLKGWWMRFLIFLPILGLVVVLIFAAMAFRAERYKRSAIIGSLFAVSGIGFMLYLSIMTIDATHSFDQWKAKEDEAARLYPVQKFLRQSDTTADTIIVYPSGIVAYRLLANRDFPWNGPLGDLNASRDVILYNRSNDTKITWEELDQFIDGNGRKLTEVYSIR
jgi:hypothetical protein